MDAQFMEERLWEYIDGHAGVSEVREIEALIGSSPVWKEKYEALLKFNELIQSASLEEPSLRFTQNLMEEINRLQVAPAAASYLNKKVIYSIGAFFLIMIAGLLVYGFAQINWSTGNTPGAPALNFSDTGWNKLWNNGYSNIFIMIDIILALVLIDKYLHRKKVAS